jgi:hypothetical protein
MKLATLLNFQSVLPFVQNLPCRNGLKAFELKKILDTFSDELKKFDDFKNDLIKATGKEKLSETDEEFSDVMKKINEASQAEIADPTPVFEQDDFNDIKISSLQIMALIELKLLKI